ncbi:MAG: CopD family protein, partial [Bacteroidales bacterium]
QDSRRAGTVLAVVLAATLLAWLWLAAQGVADEPGQLDPAAIADFAGHSRFGQVWLIRASLLLVCCLPLLPGWAARLHLGKAHLAAGLLLLMSLAFAGHVAAGHGTDGVVAHALHLVATAAWAGSLPPLLLLLDRADRLGGAWADVAARVARAYAGYGSLAVLTLFVSGVAVAAVLGDGRLSWADDYSRILMIKAVLFAIMGLLGLSNRLLAARASSSGGLPPFRLLRAVTLVEFGIALAVLLVAAILSQTSPP